MFWNPRAASLTGYNALETNTIGFARLFEPLLRMEGIIEQAKGGSCTVGARLVLKGADGARRPIMLWCIPLPRLDDTKARCLVVLRELPPPESRPEGTQVLERLQLLGQLAGSISHEIHNPLNAILLHADILEEELSQPHGGNRDQLLHSLAVMRTRTTQLYDTVQEYLTLARLPTLACEPEDLGALLEAFGLEMRERLAARGITLQLKGSAGLGPVSLHKPTFWRALGIMVQHALEAMPQGGTLTLGSRRVGAQVQLDIRDTGSGITEEQLALLLQPSAATKPEGTGLGLYLVCEVIAAHQGDIAVASTPDRGTTFTVTLPVATVDGAPAPL